MSKVYVVCADGNITNDDFGNIMYIIGVFTDKEKADGRADDPVFHTFAIAGRMWKV